MIWDDPDNIEVLREMWGRSYTATQIGEVLGVTRNSVIGKAHRLGLMQTAKPKIERPKAPKPDRKAKPTVAAVEPSPSEPIKESEYIPQPNRRPASERPTIFTLRYADCRFPQWTDADRSLSLTDKFYCGKPALPGSPYCAECREIAVKGVAA